MLLLDGPGGAGVHGLVDAAGQIGDLPRGGMWVRLGHAEDRNRALVAAYRSLQTVVGSGMDPVMLLAAAVAGGGIVAVSVALIALGMRGNRSRARRREPGPRPAPRGRLARKPSRTGSAVPPSARPADARTQRPPALAGATLQLGPVPAWQLPAEGPVAPAPRRRGLGRAFLRRSSEYASAAAGVVDEETVPEIPPTQARNDRDLRTPAVVTNASRRHDPRPAAGRVSGR